MISIVPQDVATPSTQPPSLKPGILIVTLHEGKGFSLPQTFLNAQSNQTSHSILGGGGFSVAGSTRPSSSSAAARVQPGPISASYSHAQAPISNISSLPTNHGRYSSRFLPYALLDFDKNQVFVNAVSGTPESPLWAGENTSYKFDVSRPADVTCQIYLRNPNAGPSSGRNEDLFLGACRITPKFDLPKQYVEDPKASKKDKEKAAAAFAAHQQQNSGQAGVAWLDITFGTGQIKIGVEYVENQSRTLVMDDFELLKVVGKGSFGKVMQVRKKDTYRIYALKSIRKAHIISRSEVAHTLAERSVLAQINNPFIVPLKFSFQSPEKLYLVLAFVNGGELFHHLQNEHRFDINRSRFYTAELLCALECLHGFNVIYRDLKPENILLDYTGHIALCDFGLCKLDMKDEDKTNSEC
jgi:serum/glucocorticoid-regulated kinase 2